MTSPADTLAMLDFTPGCLAHPDCRNTATHWAATVCCSEYVQVYCQQCRIETLVDRDPWACPRCGKQWEPKPKAFRWGLLGATAGGAK